MTIKRSPTGQLYIDESEDGLLTKIIRMLRELLVEREKINDQQRG
jgi:hypothetical protein